MITGSVSARATIAKHHQPQPLLEGPRAAVEAFGLPKGGCGSLSRLFAGST